jgi:Fic family protein
MVLLTMGKDKTTEILEFIKRNPLVSSKEIHTRLTSEMGYATVKRILSQLISSNLVHQQGKGKASKYVISPAYDMFFPVDIDEYFKKEIDERIIKESFNFTLITDLLYNIRLFTENELKHLTDLQETFKTNISKLSENEYLKEMERLAIDLSWKSSQIEGNTYSLLETERLIKDKVTASGKTKDEAVMLLNHKEALDFILQNPDYLKPITVSKIEDIHSILVKELSIERNVRNRRVGITGTNYRPLDNEFQIREALENMCQLINSNGNVFERALLLLVLISYIQPFNDGNKRTARIVSNAELLANGYSPISFRTIDSVEYKKAMLLFYEQNNITVFKNIFIDQFEFAVNTYF